MTGEDETHVGGIEERLESLSHLLVVLVIGSRRVDGMVGERDQPAIPCRPKVERSHSWCFGAWK